MREKQHKDVERTRKGKTQEDERDARLKGEREKAEDGKPLNPIQEAQAQFERQTYSPPPLVHVDPTTGIPISQPLEKGAEANVNTVPATGDGSREIADRNLEPERMVNRNKKDD
jgi:hypothetical protein